jgi:hypothetical protein
MRPYAKKYSSPKSRQTTKNIGLQLTTDMQVEPLRACRFEPFQVSGNDGPNRH